MYLSRIELDILKNETMIALVSPNKFHGGIEASFEGERKRRLWRIDTLNGKKYILILSEDKPNLKNFAEQFGYAGEYETKDYSPLLNRICKETKWKFRLVANPVVSKSHSNKRYAHITTEYQKNWLAERSEACGFMLEKDYFDIVSSRWYSFKKRDGKKMRFLSVAFEGYLTVTDEDKFRKALCSGIGKEKAYGQGMLTVVR